MGHKAGISNFEKLVDGLGGLEGALSLTSVAFTRLFGDKMANSMRDFAYNFKVNTGEAYKLHTAMK